VKLGARRCAFLSLAVSVGSGAAFAQVVLHPVVGSSVAFVIAPAIAVWLLVPTRVALVAGTCFGIVFFLTLFGWALAAGPQSPSLLAVFVAAVVESGPFAVIALLASRVRAMRSVGGALVVASSWTLSEHVREAGIWGLPYGEVGATQSQTGLAPLAAVFGTIGIGFSLVFVASLLAYAIAALVVKRSHTGVGPVIIATVLFVAIGVAGTWASHPLTTFQGERGALVIQSPAIAHADVAAFARELPGLVARAAISSPVDLVALPETTFRFVPDPDDDRAMRNAARIIHLPIIVGALAEREGRRYNAARVYAPYKSATSEYDKRQLVPFGEFIPLPEVFGRMTSLASASFSPGAHAQEMQGARADIAVLICFEAAFARFTREAARAGATYTLVLVNNDWFSDSVGLDLQYAMMSLRARESGVDLIVASSLGPSGVFYHDGGARLFPAGAPMIAPVRPSPTRETVYRSMGDAPILALCVAAIGFALLQAVYASGTARLAVRKA
jgi:apolipoprotein N-acyltransferase